MYRVLNEEESISGGGQGQSHGHGQNEGEKLQQEWPEQISSSKRSPDDSRLSGFIKEKLMDPKLWTIRRSVKKEISLSSTAESSPATTSSGSGTGPSSLPLPSELSSNGENACHSSSNEGRLSKLFSLRRSGSNINDASQPPASITSITSTSYSSASEIMTSSISGNSGQTSRLSSMPRLAEEEEKMLLGSKPPLQRSSGPPPPSLPSVGPDKLASMNLAQMKRRHIISTLVHSENNYVATLQRLVNNYKRPLEESNPPILPKSKVDLLFHRVPEILHCHLVFRIALTEAIRNWDRDEKIGDVFVASFSKAVVLEVYSDFINNFSLAMECAKAESKRKTALADFLKVKQITSHDRVSFFGLMVKPVQRFPQFILILQDLLKETPPGHGDRMALQLALTTLESLAEMLNERKRESEQFAAFKQKIGSISGKLNSKVSPYSSTRYLLKEEDVNQLEFNTSGHITKYKARRLLLLNDILLCVSVQGRTSEVDFNSNSTEKLSLKWAVPVQDIEIIDGAAGSTLARLLTPSQNNSATLASVGKRSSLGKSSNPLPGILTSESQGSGPSSLSTSTSKSNSTTPVSLQTQAESLAQDMADLMHDFDAVSRICSIIRAMKSSYDGLSIDATSKILFDIQKAIRQKDEEMSFLDASCLQIAFKSGSKLLKEKPEAITFQTKDPSAKKEWVVEIRLAQLAQDVNNSPGWDVLEQERVISTKMPLFVKSLLVSHETYLTEVNCGCSYSLLVPTPTRTLRKQTYAWISASKSGPSNNANSLHAGHIKILSVLPSHSGLKEIGTINLPDHSVRTIQFVPGLANCNQSQGSEDLPGVDLVWVGTDAQRVIIFPASDPEKGKEIARVSLAATVTSMQYHCHAVFIGLSSGSLAVFRRDYATGRWNLNSPQTILLGSDMVSCLFPFSGGLYAACGKRVWVIDPMTNEQVKSFTIQPRTESLTQGSLSSSMMNLSASPGSVHQMAQSGVGLWVALKCSSTICLYHTETFRHLQDINIASNVTRVLAARDISQPPRSIHVTALMASRGLLWVGTNVGIALTIPLPRLEGVPIISGRANISYHAHFGPVMFFLNVQTKVVSETPPEEPMSTNYFNVPTVEQHEVVNSTIHEESEHDQDHSQSDFETTEDGVAAKMALRKQNSDNCVSVQLPKDHPKLQPQNSSPFLVPRRNRQEESATSPSTAVRRTSKTLPRGFSLSNHTSSDMSSLDCDVFGLYDELLNVKDYDSESHEIDSQSDELRRSDPELSTIPYRVSTLDRRVQMKVTRPRSLDMSSWSIDSRMSAQTTSSSSETGSEIPSPCLSRNSSFQSSSGASVTTHSVTPDISTAPPPPAVEKKVEIKEQEVGKVEKSSTAGGKKLKKKPDTQRTVLTLMGGRGYINWRRTAVEKTKTSTVAQINNRDAFLVVWEMKL